MEEEVRIEQTDTAENPVESTIEETTEENFEEPETADTGSGGKNHWKSVLLIDFTDPKDYSLSYPPTDASMAVALRGSASGWSAEKVRVVRYQHGFLDTIPCVCQGKDKCPISRFCPIEDAIVESRFVGQCCPIEVVEAFKIFAGYVTSLGITPDDFVDIHQVVELIRLKLLERRFDLHNKDKSILVQDVAGIVQRTGEVVYRDIPNPLMREAREIRGDIEKMHSKLVASRLDKNKAAASLGGDKAATAVLQMIRNEGKRRGLSFSQTPSLPAGDTEEHEDDTVDADFEPIEVSD